VGPVDRDRLQLIQIGIAGSAWRSHAASRPIHAPMESFDDNDGLLGAPGLWLGRNSLRFDPSQQHSCIESQLPIVNYQH
jgi:hypothetical protein